MTDTPIRKKVRKRDSAPSHSAVIAKKTFIVLLFALSQVLFYFSDFFKLQSIQVYGNYRLSKDEILQTSHIPLYMDKNVVTLPLGDFQERVKQLRWIKDVRVSFSLPGKIKVQVYERTPSVMVSEKEDSNIWFAGDQEGVILYQIHPADLSKLTFPRLITQDKMELGGKIPPEKVMTLFSVLPYLPDELKKSVLFYQIDNRLEITLLIKDDKNYKIFLGREENIDNKMNRLSALRNIIDERKIKVEYIDLRHKQPVIQPRDPIKKEKKPPATTTPAPPETTPGGTSYDSQQ